MVLPFAHTLPLIPLLTDGGSRPPRNRPTTPCMRAGHRDGDSATDLNLKTSHVEGEALPWLLTSCVASVSRVGTVQLHGRVSQRLPPSVEAG